MIIGIVGAGALGTLLAVSLTEADCDVRVLLRGGLAPSLEPTAEPAARFTIEGKPSIRISVTSDAVAFSSIDVLLVAVKTYATREALAPLRDALQPSVPVVSLQNGIDARETIAAALGRDRPVALAPTTEAATLLAPRSARHTGHGVTLLGWALDARGNDAALDTLAGALRVGGLDTRVVAPIEPYVWGKLVVNAAINPLTALAGVRNGALLADPALRERAAALAREAASVAAAYGIALQFHDPVAEVERVARTTATNRSSMLQDLERGGPTEIEALSGAIVRRGRGLGVSVPQTERVLDEVRSRTKA